VSILSFRFDSRQEEIQWERLSAKNALKFKEMVESGLFIPDELRRKIEEKVDRSPAEEELLKKAKKAAVKREKVWTYQFYLPFHCFSEVYLMVYVDTKCVCIARSYDMQEIFSDGKDNLEI